MDILVRSLTLDVKVWEPSVISLFQSLGNAFANSVWEELLQSRSAFQVDIIPAGSYKSDRQQRLFVNKSSLGDSISVKEKFIHAKILVFFCYCCLTGLLIAGRHSIQIYSLLMVPYAEKLFVRKPRDNQYLHSVSQQMWEGVRANDKKTIYRLITGHDADVNVVYEQACCTSLTVARVMLLQEQAGVDHCSSFSAGNSLDRSSTSSLNLVGESEGPTVDGLEGCSLLHLACETTDIGMLELLLQYGANINAADSRGQTPLHCICPFYILC
ncbi:hypothetical protein K2173_004134 [Erythroxylum novogranatense]|uniref:ANK_REP_REGION domain-containing protein n=1 Tax=Erythroxylum novogranatense TaxID=1862640 RepID=A0AAV8SXD3_9ROSI|nr:hypothetical protein K2173_004134 [Erythroxylum novogranatense]